MANDLWDMSYDLKNCCIIYLYIYNKKREQVYEWSFIA